MTNFGLSFFTAAVLITTSFSVVEAETRTQMSVEEYMASSVTVNTAEDSPQVVVSGSSVQMSVDEYLSGNTEIGQPEKQQPVVAPESRIQMPVDEYLSRNAQVGQPEKQRPVVASESRIQMSVDEYLSGNAQVGQPEKQRPVVAPETRTQIPVDEYLSENVELSQPEKQRPVVTSDKSLQTTIDEYLSGNAQVGQPEKQRPVVAPETRTQIPVDEYLSGNIEVGRSENPRSIAKPETSSQMSVDEYLIKNSVELNDEGKTTNNSQLIINPPILQRSLLQKKSDKTSNQINVLPPVSERNTPHAVMSVDDYLSISSDTSLAEKGDINPMPKHVDDGQASVTSPVQVQVETSSQRSDEKIGRQRRLPVTNVQSDSIGKAKLGKLIQSKNGVLDFDDEVSAKPHELPIPTTSSADSSKRIQRDPNIPINLISTDKETNNNEGLVDIHTAVKRAIRSHPAITQALGSLYRQKEYVSVAKAGYLPQLNGGLSTGYRESTGDSEESITASASQLLYDFGKTSSEVTIQKLGVEREEASLGVVTEELARETANAYIEVQRHQALLKIAREQIKSMTELQTLSSQRATMGAGTKSDEMQAKSRREGARASKLQIQAQLDAWKRSLQKLMGATRPVGVSDEFPTALENACEEVPQSVDRAPQILAAKAGRNEALANIDQAKSDFFPTLSLNADYENFLNRSDDTLSGAQDDSELIVSLNITSNLFQGGARSARSRAAGHALNLATAASDQAKLNLSRALEEAKDQARSLKQSLGVQGLRYGHIVATQRLYRHQYLSLGTRSLLDILNTEQEIYQTRFDTEKTRFDLRRLQMECLFNVGAMRDTFRINLNTVLPGGFS